jgi:hypothetical protein
MWNVKQNRKDKNAREDRPFMPIKAQPFSFLSLPLLHPCGGFILTLEAQLPLHIVAASFPALPPIQPLPQLQKIIHAERRATGGNASEDVDRK